MLSSLTVSILVVNGLVMVVASVTFNESSVAVNPLRDSRTESIELMLSARLLEPESILLVELATLSEMPVILSLSACISITIVLIKLLTLELVPLSEEMALFNELLASER